MAVAAEEVLKPFYQRASEAEERLSRIEAELASDKDTKNVELLKKISELQSELEGANVKLALEQEEAKRLSTENAKLQYRILHLVRAVRESDSKLEIGEAVTGKVQQELSYQNIVHQLHSCNLR